MTENGEKSREEQSFLRPMRILYCLLAEKGRKKRESSKEGRKGKLFLLKKFFYCCAGRGYIVAFKNSFLIQKIIQDKCIEGKPFNIYFCYINGFKCMASLSEHLRWQNSCQCSCLAGLFHKIWKNNVNVRKCQVTILHSLTIDICI
jgi:hypothetical protein